MSSRKQSFDILTFFDAGLPKLPLSPRLSTQEAAIGIARPSVSPVSEAKTVPEWKDCTFSVRLIEATPMICRNRRWVYPTVPYPGG